MENQSNISIVENPSVDLNFASACLEAVAEVLKVVANLDTRYKDNSPPDGPVEPRGYQGRVSFSGAWSGEVIVAVPRSLALEVTARFVGCDPSGLDDASAGEGVGEIANQIAGRMATMLSREDFRIGISIPEIHSSTEWHLSPSDSHTVLRFECVNAPFLLIVSAVRSNSN